MSATERLADLIVNALYKDSTGYVWIGTGSSLERFDGNFLKQYLIPGSNEKIKRVNAIAETATGQIWMGNGMGLWRVDTEQNALVPVMRETMKYPVHALLPNPEGGLYVGSEAGLFICRADKAELVRTDSNLFSPRNNITDLNLQGDTLLWMTTPDGLYSMRLADRHITRYAPAEPLTPSLAHLTRIDNTLYLGTTTQGILRFDCASGRFSRYVGVGSNVISALSTDGKEHLYVGTDGNGVHFISTRQEKIVRSLRHESGREENIRSNSVYSLLVDRDNLIWIGYYQMGLDYSLYQSGLFHTYSYPPYIDTRDMPVRSIAITGQERLIGSRDGLYYVNEATNVFRTFNPPLLRSSMIFCIYPFQGKYYVGTFGGGMYVFDPAQLSITDFDPDTPQPFANGQIFCIRADYRGDLWIGTNQGLFCYRDGKQLRHYTMSNSKLPEGNVYEIYFDSTRKGWVCTENGMCLWDPVSETLRTDIFRTGFIHQEKIRVVYEDSEHRLYFLPDKGEMLISDLSMTNFRRLPSGTPLDGKDGMFILEDSRHWLWIGTGNGLYHFDRAQTVVPYGFIDGIPGPVFTLCPPVADRQGRIWMGNSRGLIYVTPDSIHSVKQYNYQPAITEQRRIGRANMTFRFSDFTYTDPAYMSCEYRLDGADNAWRMAVGQPEVNYYNLSPGRYTFRVRQVNGNGQETQQTFVVYPSGSIIAVAAALLTLGAGTYLRRRKRKKKAAARRAAAEREASHADFERETSHADFDPEDFVDEKYKKHRVSPEECEQILIMLDEVMRRDKPYTNPELKLSELATLVGSSPHSLSYLFNQHLQRNYYDFINDYRIEEFKRLVACDDVSRYTLSALAEQCGFSSRASFFRYFKKITGITPSEYMNSSKPPLPE